MDWLIWIGVALSLLGLGGVLWCIVAVARARRARLDDATLRARLQGLVAANLGALALSLFGLMLVLVGVLLA